jgi:hypothetical protein
MENRPTIASKMNLAGSARQIADPVSMVRMPGHPASAGSLPVRRCLAGDSLPYGCDVQSDF